ncbi:aldo/keto reductase [Natrialbaceae archaeon A-chndr2]
MAVNGIPQPGFGTSGHDDDTCVESVERALEVGYRHVDTAQMYDNEELVGEALERVDLDRDDVFLATKVHPSNLAYEDVLESTEASLERLGVESVDLLYVHWPTDAYDSAETLPAMDEVVDRGLTRHVGVSNFTIELLEEARSILEAPIVANQVELHPRLQQPELVDYGREHDITTVAYCPVAQGSVADIDTLRAIAATHGATPFQIALAWQHAREGVVPIPKATGAHIEENFTASEIELTEAELEAIEGLDRGERLIDPEAAAWNQ